MFHTPQQKADIIAKVTAAMIEVEGENMRGVTWVKINEFNSGDRAIGGQALKTSDVKALAEGKAAMTVAAPSPVAAGEGRGAPIGDPPSSCSCRKTRRCCHSCMEGLLWNCAGPSKCREA